MEPIFARLPDGTFLAVDEANRVMVDTINQQAAEIERLKASAPAWHDKPTCEGVWLRDMDAYDIKLWCGTLSYHLFDDWYEANSRWYGPIPEEPK